MADLFMRLSALRSPSNGAEFDHDCIGVMSSAYDLAIRSLHDTGQPDIVNEIIAKKIISLAKTGERDVIVLSDFALNALGSVD